MHRAPRFVHARTVFFLWVSLLGLCAGGSVWAEETEASFASPAGSSANIQGFEFGVRAGYGFRLNRPSYGFAEVLPIWVDLGARLHPNWYVGGFFQYGFPRHFNDCATPAYIPGYRVQCSGDELRFGVNVHYHLRPNRELDPWAGLGVGYEISHSSVSFLPPGGRAGGEESSFEFSGVELLSLQLGVDYRFSRTVGIGPFVTFTLAKLSNSNATISKFQGWLMVGARVVFDVMVR